ncbi:MAG: FtsX-like permease family protein [Bacteroidaceae bacterium]|nr:FtsX-like permease family protein [Bacteroidaceae bacterium]
MRQTIKTFWAHRKKNGWLIAEIALISLLSFYFVDHTLMIGYNTYICRADGEFEREHLVTGYVAHITKKENNNVSYNYDITGKDLANLYALREYLMAMPEVQSVCFTDDFIGYRSWHQDVIVYPEGDTTRTCPVYSQNFVPGQHYFETQGLTPVDGSPMTQILSEECPNDGVVISRSLAISLFGNDQVVGRTIVVNREKQDPPLVKHCKIMGVLKDVKIDPNERYCYTIFEPVVIVDNMPRLLLRLKPEANAREFLAKWVENRLERDDYCVTSLQIYEDSMGNSHSITGTTVFLFFIGILLCLFMLNVVIGTLGTFWLQIRKRTGDIGIMRSFGAKRRTIFGMIWKEAALLTFIACLIGQIIWLQIAVNSGLADGGIELKSGRETEWITQFWPHFLVVSAVQILLLLAIVTLGIIIPTLIAMYRKPVNALRHE